MSQLRKTVEQNIKNRQQRRLEKEEEAQRERAEFASMLGDLLEDIEYLIKHYEGAHGHPLQLKTLMPLDDAGNRKFVGYTLNCGPDWVRFQPSETPAHVLASGVLASIVQEGFTDNSQFQELRIKHLEQALAEWLDDRDLRPKSPQEEGGDASARAEVPEHSRAGDDAEPQD